MAKRPPVRLGDLTTDRTAAEALAARRVERAEGLLTSTAAPTTRPAPGGRTEGAPTERPEESLKAVPKEPSRARPEKSPKEDPKEDPKEAREAADRPKGPELDVGERPPPPAGGPEVDVAADDPAALDEVTPVVEVVSVVGTTISADDLSDEARIWENRSGEADSPYQEMRGPDIAYDEGVWYAEQPDGSWRAFHEGSSLDFRTVDTILTEALEFEAVAGTGMWGMGSLSDLDLRLDGATGDLITPAGTVLDPDAVTVVRAADGSVLIHDAATGTFSTFQAIGVPLDPGAVPSGPYDALGTGPGGPAPLDGIEPGERLAFDPEDLTFADADGDIVGFQETLFDDARSWENRSGDPDSPYQDMTGEDITYVDGRWYVSRPDGSYDPFHEGRYLDFTELTVDAEFLTFETTAGTPFFGVDPGDLGLRLDGETGGFVNDAGDPVDPADFDPSAPDFGFGGDPEPDASEGSAVPDDPVPVDGDLDSFGAGAGARTDGDGEEIADPLASEAAGAEDAHGLETSAPPDDPSIGSELGGDALGGDQAIGDDGGLVGAGLDDAIHDAGLDDAAEDPDGTLDPPG